MKAGLQIGNNTGSTTVKGTRSSVDGAKAPPNLDRGNHRYARHRADRTEVALQSFPNGGQVQNEARDGTFACKFLETPAGFRRVAGAVDVDGFGVAIDEPG